MLSRGWVPNFTHQTLILERSGTRSTKGTPIWADFGPPMRSALRPQVGRNRNPTAFNNTSKQFPTSHGSYRMIGKPKFIVCHGISAVRHRHRTGDPTIEAFFEAQYECLAGAEKDPQRSVDVLSSWTGLTTHGWELHRTRGLCCFVLAAVRITH